MEPQAVTVMTVPDAGTAVPSVDVSFTDPSVWAPFGVTPQGHWKLKGAGKAAVEGDRLLLQGKRHRPFWVAANTEVRIPLGDIVNVIHEGSLVQCHVRLSDGTQVLRMWAADRNAAERLVAALPTEHTAEFDRLIAERRDFDAALAGTSARTWVTPSLVAINCLVFVLTVVGGAGLLEPNGAVLIRWGSDYGPKTLDGEPWRLFTSMFLHFGILHLALNMWVLWGLGRLTERLFGPGYYLLLYLFAGLCGSLASLYWHPNVNGAGASGAIFGVLGGLVAFMLNPATRIPMSIASGHLKSAGVFVLYNLANGFSHSGIDNAAHLGGLAGGFVIGWVLARPVDRAARQHPLPRLLTVSAIAVALLCAIAWPLFRPSPTVAAERIFRKRFQDFLQYENSAVAAQKALGKLDAAGTIDHHEWGRRTEAEVIPQWQKAEDGIIAAQLPEASHLYPLRQALIEYIDQAKKALDLLARSAENDDDELGNRGKQLADENAAKGKEVAALIKQVY